MAKKVEVVIMTGVFMIVFGSFSIPIIIYATNSQDATSTSNVVAIDQIDIRNGDCSRKVRT